MPTQRHPRSTWTDSEIQRARNMGYSQSQIDFWIKDQNSNLQQEDAHNDWWNSPEQVRIRQEESRQFDARAAESRRVAAQEAAASKERNERLGAARDKAFKQAEKQRLKQAVESWRVGMEGDIKQGLSLSNTFSQKEREIGRKLNESEKAYYRQYGWYPASHQEALRRSTWDELKHQESTPAVNERFRRIHEARNRSPLENAIRNLFTPVSNQVPKHHLQ